MIKHPAFRVNSVSKIDTKFLLDFGNDMESFGRLTPFSKYIIDFEIVGSYARDCAELHSDIDINIATISEDSRLLSRELIRNNHPQMMIASKYLKSLWFKYGIKIEVALQHPTVKDVLVKSYYSLREMLMYDRLKVYMDINYDTKIAISRTKNILRPPKLTLCVFEDDGVRDFDPTIDDPFLPILDEWRKKYGTDILEYGGTPETAHMKK